MKMVLYPCGLTPKAYNPSLIREKSIRKIPNKEHSTKYLTSTPQN